MDLGLTGRRIIVTGGSAGLGKALAKVLVAEGADVAICARREDKLLAAAEEVTRAGDGAKVFAQAADVAKAADVASFVEAAATELGGIDGVVNNAGTGAAFQFQDVDDDAWQADYELKVMAAIRVSRAALPYLRESDSAAIVHVLNNTAKAPRAKSLPTSVSRAAGLALTKAMSLDLADDRIRVNAVCNGFLKSEQWAKNAAAVGKTEEELVEFLIESSGVPAGRFGEDYEWARLVAFILSPAGAYVNGAALNIDGGLSPVV